MTGSVPGSSTSGAGDLPVTDAALSLFLAIAGDGLYEHNDSAMEDLRAVAAPLVAAELRRVAHGLAEGTWTHWGTVDAVVSGLRKRANALDPDGGTTG